MLLKDLQQVFMMYIQRANKMRKTLCCLKKSWKTMDFSARETGLMPFIEKQVTKSISKKNKRKKQSHIRMRISKAYIDAIGVEERRKYIVRLAIAIIVHGMLLKRQYLAKQRQHIKQTSIHLSH